MKTTHEQAVDQVCCETLEKVCFLFAEPVERDGLANEPEEAGQADIAFTGAFGGALTMAAPHALCSEIAANMLGVEPDEVESRDQCADALKEALNIICGQLLTAIAGEEPVFELSVPETHCMDLAAWRALRDDPRTRCFMIDDRPALLRLAMEE